MPNEGPQTSGMSDEQVNDLLIGAQMFHADRVADEVALLRYADEVDDEGAIFWLQVQADALYAVIEAGNPVAGLTGCEVDGREAVTSTLEHYADVILARSEDFFGAAQFTGFSGA